MPSKEKIQLSAAAIPDNGFQITAAFQNGEHRHYHLTSDHPLYNEFAIHGLGQKIRAQAANEQIVERQIEKVDALLAAFTAGKWSVNRSQGEAPPKNLLVEALVHRFDRSPEDARAFVDTLTKKQQADMRKLPDIAAAILELSSRQAVDEPTSALLDSFLSKEETGVELF